MLLKYAQVNTQLHIRLNLPLQQAVYDTIFTHFTAGL
jgi:hypothetical protein